MAKGGAGVLSVDGKDVVQQEHRPYHSGPVDHRRDLRHRLRHLHPPVDDADYQVPFPFTGTISKVDFKLGPPQMLPEDSKAAQDMKNNLNK